MPCVCCGEAGVPCATVVLFGDRVTDCQAPVNKALLICRHFPLRFDVEIFFDYM